MFVSGVVYGLSYQDFWVVLVILCVMWEVGFEMFQLYVFIFGFVLFIVGIFLFFLFMGNYMCLFEKIDSGFYEVINGNFDYQFLFDYNEELL